MHPGWQHMLMSGERHPTAVLSRSGISMFWQATVVQLQTSDIREHYESCTFQSCATPELIEQRLVSKIDQPHGSLKLSGIPVMKCSMKRRQARSPGCAGIPEVIPTGIHLPCSHVLLLHCCR